MAKRCARIALGVLLIAISIRAQQSPFRTPEVRVAASPSEARELVLPASEKILDFDAWSSGAEIAILVRNAESKSRVLAWHIGSSEAPAIIDLPTGFEPRAIACHPAARKLFLSGRSGGQSVILLAQPREGSWHTQSIFQTGYELRRLLVGPRPFQTDYDAVRRIARESYRLFFAARLPDGTYSTRSITEDGKREYQVLGSKSSYVEVRDADTQPNLNLAGSALPAAFHPAGHILIWQDVRGCFQQLIYDHKDWGKAAPVAGTPCGGSLTVTPNGAALLQWQRGQAGVTVLGGRDLSRTQQATEYNFITTPSSVPDGKGIVGLVEKPNGQALVYAPIHVPLADVVNAWMFTEDAADQQAFANHAGLFRGLKGGQLFELYDSEAYLCGGYDATTPTRPYLVTTDILWELVAAAYEGTFIVQERQRAIPDFWSFVGAANAALRSRAPGSPWATAFRAVAGLHTKAASSDSETARLARAAGRAYSPAFGREFNYSELKPRGHYGSTTEMATYFKAVHYLTELAQVRDAVPLNSLPAEVKTKAMQWIAAYQPFIAASRARLVWASEPFPPPPFARHPASRLQVFPLSWGFDNEVLLSTVFHPDWLEPEQIKGASGPRLVPSGIDIAAALGSGFARSLLENDLHTYPALGPALDALAARRPLAAASSPNLYDAWIGALAVQWAGEVTFPDGPPQAGLWKTKRLQTGLASWATLRHATVLVNERTAAECGEGGFEEIVLQPPRGYVEPDPKTLGAIASLFDQMEQAVAHSIDFTGGRLPADYGEDEPLRQGLLRRLRESGDKARLFQSIAEKELRGEELSNQEYEEILYVGRVAEHHLLVFKSLANKDLALSNPDPMMKIADVAGGGKANIPLLEVAVGRPLEWDQVVPFFGRREIVKGSVYSYYEFTTTSALNDSEWRERVDREQRPDWIQRFISARELSCPANAPF